MKPQFTLKNHATGWLWIVVIAATTQTFVFSSRAFGQDNVDLSTSFSAIDDSSPQRLGHQIELLRSPVYRERVSARKALEKYPKHTLQIIEQQIDQVDTNVGIQLVDLVSGMALHSDLEISAPAVTLLTSLANSATSVGRMATNSLSAIADLKEEEAVKIMVENGAYIGPQDFSINGKQFLDRAPYVALVIDQRFVGTERDLEWIRYLKSIDVVYLNGPNFAATAIEATSRLKKLKGLKLRNLSITPEQLSLFADLQALEQFGVAYVNMDDSYLPALLQLPVSESIRLLGTKISESAKVQMEARFVGVEIYRGKGGFLGISSTGNSTRIKEVTVGSAAFRAGLRNGDTILAVNNQPVANFEELRGELSKYDAGESVEIEFNRLFGIPAQSHRIMVQLQQEQ